MRRHLAIAALMFLSICVASCRAGEPTAVSTTAAPPSPIATSLPRTAIPAPTATAVPPTDTATPTHAPTPTPVPPTAAPAPPLDAESATLASLEQIDDYPLYIMRYVGDYRQRWAAVRATHTVRNATTPDWVCSLFAALGDAEGMRYGRNFDWHYSPALLLFTDPPDGYASVSMVDIAYLVDDSQVRDLTERSLDERRSLLDAPLWPFDGMNEHGLVVGMAAVPLGDVPPDPNKATTDSLMVMREVLDRARDVDEAVAIIQSYNIDWAGGPPLHYLVADRSGRATLVEFYEGQTVLLPNDAPWHQATNFLRAATGESEAGQCWRYDRVRDRLVETQGRLTPGEGMDLLSRVSQESTQWSIVYGMSTGDVTVAMGQAYDEVHTIHLDLADPGPTPSARQPGQDETVTVGLYADDGAADACVTAADAMFQWMGYAVERTDAGTVNDEELARFDVLYFPGGSTHPYQEDIDAEGKEKIRGWVDAGGCYIGTCAGALFAAERAVWEGRADPLETLGLFPGTVEGPIPDIYADPEFGMCQVDLTPHPITGEAPGAVSILYYNGPFFRPAPNAEVDVVGRYHIGGEPALVALAYGQGRVFLTGPHPEWEEDDERDGVDYFDRFDDQGSDWALMRQATRWCLHETD